MVQQNCQEETSQESSARNVSRICVVCVGGIWKGVIMVADIEELGTLDAAEIHARRLNAKEVKTPKNGEHFILPKCRWHSKIAWKKSWNPKIHCNAGPT